MPGRRGRSQPELPAKQYVLQVQMKIKKCAEYYPQLAQTLESFVKLLDFIS